MKSSVPVPIVPFPVVRPAMTAVLLAAAVCGCGDSSTTPRGESSKSKSRSSESVATATSKTKPSVSTGSKPAPAPQISDEAFRMAAYEGRLDSVRAAIDNGMDVNGVDPVKMVTALHMAAFNGHTETVKYLIKQGATVDCRDAEGKTPLIHTCTGPFAKTAQALIDAGADINARDSVEGFTPLMMAAGLGEADVVKVLLENNADKSLLDADQESASDHAQNSGHSDIVTLLQ